jgi:hypothetical protein
MGKGDLFSHDLVSKSKTYGWITDLLEKPRSYHITYPLPLSPSKKQDNTKKSNHNKENQENPKSPQTFTIAV